MGARLTHSVPIAGAKSGNPFPAQRMRDASSDGSHATTPELSPQRLGPRRRNRGTGVRDPLIEKIGKAKESNASRSLSRLFWSGLVESLVVDLPAGPVSCYIPPNTLFQHLATDFPIMFETRFGASPLALEEF